MKIKFLALALGTAGIAIIKNGMGYSSHLAIVTALSSRQFHPLIQHVLLDLLLVSVALATGVFAVGLYHSIKRIDIGKRTFQALLLASYLSVFLSCLLAPFCGNIELPNAYLILINCLLSEVGLLLAIKNIWLTE